MPSPNKGTPGPFRPGELVVVIPFAVVAYERIRVTLPIVDRNDGDGCARTDSSEMTGSLGSCVYIELM